MRLVVLALCWLACSCAQTDIIAVAANPLCLHAVDCEGTHSCPASQCGASASSSDRCALAALPLRVGDGCSDSAPNQSAFRFGVCSCTDYVSTAGLSIDAWDSRTGRAASAASALGIDGSLDLKGQLSVDGSVQLTGELSSVTAQNAQITALVLSHAHPPCNCSAANQLDIEALVAARASDNDDAAHGLDPSHLDGFAGVTTLDLPCGRYYLTRVAGSGDLQISAHGNVQLFVAGNMELDRSLVVRPDPLGRFELLVAGNVRVAADLQLGTQVDAPRANLYVGGRGTIDLGGTTTLAGVLYAPQAELVTRAAFTSHGALFVRRVSAGAQLDVHYDVALGQPVACDQSGKSG
ncbi:MAG TPA: hypothetical protein VF331_04130 [Polyangiales bacterium]